MFMPKQNDIDTLHGFFKKIDQQITDLKSDMETVDVFSYTGQSEQIVVKKDRQKLKKIIAKINQLKPTQQKLKLISHTQIKAQQNEITDMLDQVSAEFATAKRIHDRLIAVIVDYIEAYKQYIDNVSDQLDKEDIYDFDFGTWDSDKLWKLLVEEDTNE